ncbi:hypothetical protein ACQY0O_007800 [Thecaphora frezii]
MSSDRSRSWLDPVFPGNYAHPAAGTSQGGTCNYVGSEAGTYTAVASARVPLEHPSRGQAAGRTASLVSMSTGRCETSDSTLRGEGKALPSAPGDVALTYLLDWPAGFVPSYQQEASLLSQRSSASAPDLTRLNLGQASLLTSSFSYAPPSTSSSYPSFQGNEYRPELLRRSRSSGATQPAHVQVGPLRMETQEENGRRRIWHRAPNGQFASLTSLAQRREGGTEQADSTSPRRIRKRRKGDEIERRYACDFPGCSKAYGTLNHLNTHRKTCEHGPRLNAAVNALPSQSATRYVRLSLRFLKHRRRPRQAE